MHVTFSQKELAFREEVKAFFRDDFPADIREKQDKGIELSPEDYIRWQQEHRTRDEALDRAGRDTVDESLHHGRILEQAHDARRDVTLVVNRVARQLEVAALDEPGFELGPERVVDLSAR